MIIKHDKIDSVSVSRNENHHDFITGKRGFICVHECLYNLECSPKTDIFVDLFKVPVLYQ